MLVQVMSKPERTAYGEELACIGDGLECHGECAYAGECSDCALLSVVDVFEPHEANTPGRRVMR